MTPPAPPQPTPHWQVDAIRKRNGYLVRVTMEVGQHSKMLGTLVDDFGRVPPATMRLMDALIAHAYTKGWLK